MSAESRADPRYRRGYLAGWFDAREHAGNRRWKWLCVFATVSMILWVPVIGFVTARLLDLDAWLAQMWTFGGLIVCGWLLGLAWLSGDLVGSRDRKRRQAAEVRLDEQCRQAEADRKRAAAEARLAAEAAAAERKAAKARRRAEKAENRRVLEVLDEAWPTIIATVPTYSRVLWMLLDESYPLAVKGGVVTVVARDQKWVLSLSEPRMRGLLGRVILVVTSEELTVELEGPPLDAAAARDSGDVSGSGEVDQSDR